MKIAEMCLGRWDRGEGQRRIIEKFREIDQNKAEKNPEDNNPPGFELSYPLVKPNGN